MINQSNRQHNWHPNFRIESTLPDTRVIHANFILKLVVYTTLLVSVLFVLEREYRLLRLKNEINRIEQQVQTASSADNSRLQKSQQFRKLGINVKEVQQFFRAPLIAHESIVELSAIKPADLLFTRLSFSESVIQEKRNNKSKSKGKVVFKLNISGNVEDLPVLTKFKRELEESSLLNPSGYNVTIDESIEQRDAGTGIVPFKLTISMNSLGKDSK